jgi:hypothetical protein
MDTKNLFLNQHFRALLEEHSVLLSAEGNKGRKTIKLRISGYNDAVHLISDIVKVSILALSAQDTYGNATIPEPNSNICNVLSIILDLLPYEETELLDILYSLQSETMSENELDDFYIENIFLIPPTGLCA